MSKMLVMGALALVSLTAHGEREAGRKGADFETRKAEMVKHLEERLAALQQHKACLQGAKDQEALRACQKTMMEHRRKMREGMRERREARQGERRGPGPRHHGGPPPGGPEDDGE